ncbi:hypothetical protein [Pseudomonas fluorescens group sp. PF-69]
MKDHTDRAAIRVVVAMISMLLFITIIWGPVNTIWVAPWIYDGTTFGSLAWRKAWVINGWILFAPIFVTFGYCVFTMARAIRKDEIERSNRRAS